MTEQEELEQAFLAAHRAGDEKAARLLADEIARVRAGPTLAAAAQRNAPSVTDVPLGARREARATSPLLAGVIGAGRQADLGLQGLMQPLLVGTPAGKEQRERMRGADSAYQALQMEHPVATTLGEISPWLAFRSPLGMAAAAGAQFGSPSERAGNAAMTYAGGKLGEMIGRGITRLKGPQSMAVGTAPQGGAAPSNIQNLLGPKPKLADEFFGKSAGNKWGIPLSLGQETQRRPVQIAESVLENFPTTAGVMKAGRDRTFSAWNRKIGEQFGAENAARLSPEMLGSNRNRIGKTIGDIAERNRIMVDGDLVRDLLAVETRIQKELVGDERAIAQKQLQEVYRNIDAETMQIPGQLYKALQSQFGKIGKNRGGTVSDVMHDIRAAMRNAMERSLPEQEAAAWRKANEQYFNVIQVAHAARADPTGKGISPKTLLATVNQEQKASKFGGGNQLAELARWGKGTLPDMIPWSGTAERNLYQKILTNPATAGAALTGGAGVVHYADADAPEAAYVGLGTPYLMARLLAGKPASALTRQMLGRAGAAAGAVAGGPLLQQMLAGALRQRAQRAPEDEESEE